MHVIVIFLLISPRDPQTTVTRPGGESSAQGDPHFTSYDGLYINLYTAGDFIYAMNPKRDFMVSVVVILSKSILCCRVRLSVIGFPTMCTTVMKLLTVAQWVYNKCSD